MENSFYDELRNRKIIQNTAIYVASSWGILQAIDFFSSRYQWPKMLFDLGLILLLTGLPFIIIRSWFHGTTGKQFTSKKEIILIAINGLALVLVVVYFTLNRKIELPHSSPSKSIAVLPLESSSLDRDQEYFSSGMMDEILDQLLKIKDLKVISRRSSLIYRDSKLSTKEIAQKLEVSNILEYNVQKLPNLVRITARLIDAETDQLLWSGNFERDVKDVFVVQREISLGIAKALEVTFSRQEVKGLNTPVTHNTNAYDLYLKGKFYLNSEQPADIDTAISYLKKATAEDPQFLQAYTELSWAYGLKNFWFDPTGGWDVQAFVAAENAIKLDSSSAEAVFVRAFASWTFKNNFPHEQVIREYKRALALNPNLHRAHTQLALIYFHLDLIPQALKEAIIGSELDRYDGFSQITVPTVYYFGRQYQKALEGFSQLPDAYMGFGFRISLRALALIELGRDKEAEELLAKGLANKPNEPSMNGAYAVLAAKRGDKVNAETAIQKVINAQAKANHFHHASYSIGVAYALLHDKEKAVYWLSWSANHGMPAYAFFRDDPSLVQLKNYPPFQQLLAQLSEEHKKYEVIAND